MRSAPPGAASLLERGLPAPPGLLGLPGQGSVAFSPLPDLVRIVGVVADGRPDLPWADAEILGGGLDITALLMDRLQDLPDVEPMTYQSSAPTSRSVAKHDAGVIRHTDGLFQVLLGHAGLGDASPASLRDQSPDRRRMQPYGEVLLSFHGVTQRTTGLPTGIDYAGSEVAMAQ